MLRWNYFPKLPLLGYVVCVSKLCIPNQWFVTLEISYAHKFKGGFRTAGYLFFSGAPILLFFGGRKFLFIKFGCISPLPSRHTNLHLYTVVALVQLWNGQYKECKEMGESQNGCSWKVPMDGSQCNPLKQMQLEQVAQDHVQLGLVYLQRWRLCNYSGQPVSVFRYFQSFFSGTAPLQLYAFFFLSVL